MRRNALPQLTCALVSGFGRGALALAAGARRVCVASAPAALYGALTFAPSLGCAPTTAVARENGTKPVASVFVAHEDKTSPALKTFLNDRMKQELAALELRGEASPLGYTADASIVTLARAPDGSRNKVSCTVLLTLLDSTHSPGLKPRRLHDRSALWPYNALIIFPSLVRQGTCSLSSQTGMK